MSRVPPAKSTRHGAWTMIDWSLDIRPGVKRSFREESRHLAKFFIAIHDQLLAGVFFQLSEVTGKNFAHQRSCAVVILVSSAVGLGDDLVDNPHLLQVGGGNAQRLGSEFFLAGILPDD